MTAVDADPDPRGDGDELDSPGAAAAWSVYVLLSADGQRTYVGITTDTARRLEQHNGALPGGAKATRRGRPWTLGVTYGPYATQSEALKVELRVKKLRGPRRLTFEPE